MTHKLLAILLLSVLSSLISGQDEPKGLYIQQANDLTELKRSKPISLAETIEQGLRKNYKQKYRNLSAQSLHLGWQETWDTFWLPQIELSLETAPQRVARLKKGSLLSSRSQSTSGSFALSLGNYTLFNWGKDYLSHLNEKDNFLKSKRNLTEDKRQLRLNLIGAYFALAHANNVFSYRKNQLQQASFIYRFNREKVSIGKISKQEYYQSRQEYLRAQNDFQSAKTSKEYYDEAMAVLIADTPGTRYILKDEFSYQRMSFPVNEALNLSKRDNPGILDSKVVVQNAHRELKIARLENLPLPKFDLNLGAYRHTLDSSDYRSRYTTDENGSNLDIVASIEATWTLFGKNGFLNRRRTNQRILNRQKSFNQLKEAYHTVQSEVQQSYININYIENHIRILEARVPTMEKLYDTVLDNYMSKKTNFLNYKNSLHDLVDSQIELSKQYYLHLKTRLEIANLLGKENLPGENFERFAVTKEEGTK